MGSFSLPTVIESLYSMNKKVRDNANEDPSRVHSFYEAHHSSAFSVTASVLAHASNTASRSKKSTHSWERLRGCVQFYSIVLTLFSPKDTTRQAGVFDYEKCYTFR